MVREDIIDGEGHILGRLASEVAKQLLNDKDKQVVIVNAERIIISGSKESLIEDYKRRRERGSREKGPYFPKMPDRVVRRTIRGMLPYKRQRGRDALSRLRVYLGIPDEYSIEGRGKGGERERIENAEAGRLSLAKYLTLGEVCKYLGWVPKRK